MILVTGGAGYIGSHTLKHLLNNNYNCIVADNLVYGHIEAVDPRAKFVNVDLMNKLNLKTLFQDNKIEGVIHFAAYTYVGESVNNPQKYYFNNVVGTLNLLEVMLEHDVKRIVFSSTCATYGEPQYTPIDEDHPQSPINPYGHSKFMIEQILADYQKAYGLKYIALRYFNAAGADIESQIGESHNPETHLIPLVLKAIKGDLPNIKVFGTDYDTPDGTCIRDYIHVEDLALAHRLALENLEKYSGYINLGTGIGKSVKEILTSATAVTTKDCPIMYSERRDGDPARLFANNTKAKSVLGWEPKYTNIDDIIMTAWKWEKDRKF
jgi:UDP-glucose 4-epimerase